MFTIKHILSAFFTLFLLFIGTSKTLAQTCGEVTNFTYSITNNNNGTKTYRFYVTVQSSGSNRRSVKLTIKCPNNTFVSNRCEETRATAKTINYGPYTVNACTGDIQLIWTGYSNEECENSPCTPEQAAVQLPVELSKFQVVKEEDKALLNWETASEKDNDKFVVERSTDGLAFEAIGELEGNGTTTEAKHYAFVDKYPLPGVNYYRLKQVDFNGNIEYSNINSVEIESGDEILVYPSLVSSELNIALPISGD
ncbi:MAG: hypothetical protein IT258_00760, partial [Saprospiraceae bacterium]|nr:hypothetical protein [Saprospiraceae bacterium]